MQFKIEKQKRKEIACMRAASREDFLNFTATPHYVARCEDHFLHGTAHDQQSSTRESKDWHGTKDWQEWQDILRDGWSDGATKAAQMCKEIEGTVASLRKVQECELHDEGDEIDIDAFLAGEENHWYQYPERDTPAKRSKIVRLGLNVAVHAGYESVQLLWRGVIATALIEVLQSHGYQVEVLCFWQAHGRSNSNISYVSFPAKSAGEKILPERLASMIGHPSAFRRGFFSAVEKLPAEKFDKYLTFGGYGMSVRDYLFQDTQPLDIYLNENACVSNAKQAVQVFKNYLDESGLLKKAD
jgi:hypothetical protein